MKKLFFVLIVVFALLLMSCKAKTEVREIVSESPKEIEKQKTTTSVMEDIDKKISDAKAVCDEWLSKNLGARSCGPVTSQQGSVGSIVVFPFAIKNQMPQTTKFSIVVKFIKTQGGVGKVGLEADKDFMGEWLTQNDFETYYELGSQEILNKPILIKIGDLIGEGKATAPGYSYVFEVQPKIYNEGFLEVYDSPKQFYVKVT